MMVGDVIDPEANAKFKDDPEGAGDAHGWYIRDGMGM